MKNGLRIVFIGTPEFAVPSLDALTESVHKVVGVITAADKPAGRGQKMLQSAVKKYATKKNIPVLQPTNLKEEHFTEELRALKPDLQVVVAFRMLPECVWKLPPKGTFNLHASLLPQYRGAAPINHAIINGETETGLTTFFLAHNIDTGHIIMQKKIDIGPYETAGELHDRLMKSGSYLVKDTVDAIAQGSYALKNQSELIGSKTKINMAPKIFKKDCHVDWCQSTTAVFNHIRGLNPYPAAFTLFIDPGGTAYIIKLFHAEPGYPKSDATSPGQIITDGKTYLKVATSDGVINILMLQKEGKKRMRITEFLRGFHLTNSWKAK